MSQSIPTFLRSYERYVLPDEMIVVAVSGGVDSMVLLSLFLEYHQREHIIVAHFDHSLRGDASDSDHIFVEDFCRENNICFVSEKCDIDALSKATRSSLESAGREARYEFLMRVCRNHSARLLSTAHHLDDRIETALFNLIRGTKLDGIHALSEIHTREAITLLRPLIRVTKDTIRAFAEENGIPFREDSTNGDTLYLRNHIRHVILPEFRAINPHAPRSLEHFITYTEEVSAFIEERVRAWLSKYPLSEFSAGDFREESHFFQREILHLLYRDANHGTIGLTEGNIEEMIRFVTTAV